MFWQKKASYLEETIDTALEALNEKDIASDEYETILNRVSTLHKMKVAEQQPTRVSPDTLAVIATNLVGLFLIIRHENVNVITSKAMSHIIKPKTP